MLFGRFTHRIAGCMIAMPVVLSSLPAFAGDAKGQFSLHGIGAQTCAQFLDEVKKNDPGTNNLIASWILGYMTASNRLDKATFDVAPAMPSEALVQMTVNVCQKSPDARVESAVYALFQGLAPARVVADSPMLELEAGTTKFELRRETFVAVQDALKKKKFYTGRTEDKMTPALEAALKAYQKDQKLTENGLPDTATVVRLLLASNDKPQ